jgi:glutamate N-acetyltransferase/amino-acid N-acetyltransferase
VRVTVRHAPNTARAVGLGKAIINSPLVKTAVFGDDANVGRLVMAAGDYLGNQFQEFDSRGVSISIGGRSVFSNGAFLLDADVEEEVSRHLQAARLDPDNCRYPAHDRLVEIEIDMAQGSESAEVIGSDLSYGYVRENADYRT